MCSSVGRRTTSTSSRSNRITTTTSSTPSSALASPVLPFVMVSRLAAAPWMSTHMRPPAWSVCRSVGWSVGELASPLLSKRGGRPIRSMCHAKLASTLPPPLPASTATTHYSLPIRQCCAGLAPPPHHPSNPIIGITMIITCTQLSTRNRQERAFPPLQNDRPPPHTALRSCPNVRAIRRPI